MSILAADHRAPPAAVAAAPVSLHAVCDHLLGGLPCVNYGAHSGGGRGCVHVSTSGVPDRHDHGDDE